MEDWSMRERGEREREKQMMVATEPQSPPPFVTWLNGSQSQIALHFSARENGNNIQLSEAKASSFSAHFIMLHSEHFMQIDAILW
jgi:hypothetical protein